MSEIYVVVWDENVHVSKSEMIRKFILQKWTLAYQKRALQGGTSSSGRKHIAYSEVDDHIIDRLQNLPWKSWINHGIFKLFQSIYQREIKISSRM